jgi:GT2 family glycosyltransferase
MASPEIAVCVTTRDRAHLLPRLMQALAAQTLSPESFEVVIADDGSRDTTQSVLESLAYRSPLRMRVLRRPEPGGPAAGRNLAWRSADAPLVAFTDDDCVPEPRWLELHLRALRVYDISQGAVEPNPEQNGRAGPFSRAIGVADENGLYETCNIAYRRAWLERLGGFDEGFRRSGEDADLAWRARDLGATTTFRSEAVVLHDVEQSSWRRAMRDTLRFSGVVKLVDRHPHLAPRFGRGRTWRRSHRPAALAIAGIGCVIGGTIRRQWLLVAVGSLLTVPYGYHRLALEPIVASRRRRFLLLPATLAVDAAELAVIRSSRLRLRLAKRASGEDRSRASL